MGKRKPRRLPGARLARPAFDLVGAGASRARELLKRLLSSRHADRYDRLRATGTFPAAAKPGRLEAFQRSVDALENHAAAFDLAVDFGHFRRRLEALLAVLLEVDDDRLVGEAAGQMQEELGIELPRAEAVFLTPEALFGALDLSRPALAESRAACESGNHDLARARLLEHLAGKPVPDGLEDWLTVRSSRVLDEAALVGRGFLALGPGSGAVGWTFFGHPIRWEKVREAEPHSHTETAVLSQAYIETGDESYAREAVAHLLEWAARVVPPDVPAREGASGRTVVDPPSRAIAASSGEGPAGPWETSCTAGRLLNWAVTFVALRASRAFTPEAARAFLVLVHESTRVLRVRVREGEARPPTVMAEMGAALLVTGTLFDEFRDASSWREEGKRLLCEAARAGVLPDGGLQESGSGSPSFEAHERMLDCFVTAALAARRSGPPCGADDAAPEQEAFSHAARSMFEFASALVFPDGRFPGEARGDPARAPSFAKATEGSVRRSPAGAKGGAKDRVSRLARARALLGLGKAAPGPSFRAFGDSGVFVMRAGAGEAPDSLVFRTPSRQSRYGDSATVGPPSIHVALGGSRGREVLSLSGPLVRAGGDKAEAGAGPMTMVGRSRAHAGPPCDYVRATFDLAKGGVETREVLYVDRRFWVIAIRVRSVPEAERTLELDLFPTECLPSPDGRRLIIGIEEAGALVALAAPTDSGFRLDETPTGRTARATACAEDVHFIAVVYPLHGEEAHSITVEPLVGSGDGTARARGFLLARPAGEYAVGFPHGEEGVFGEETPFGELPRGIQAAALARSDGPWRTLFSLECEGK